MENTDTSDPDYYLKVVDCQKACPAHTDVPEYIRLIADGRYQEAYLVNRQSNVFPGILGRVCDRPCEPACRRNRVDTKPVAICRLKRVAADHKGIFEQPLIQKPTQKNGKKVALIGAGPASLTVANDLIPFGYEIHLFEKEPRAGGAMLTQVPGFRLPDEVLTEEVDVITDHVQLHLGAQVNDIQDIKDQGFDAIFVGTGAPKGRSLPLPGIESCKKDILIGVEFLASVAFEHTSSCKETVIVIGGGNTAMDCCRTALRLGAKQVICVSPEPYDQMLASEWEKEDCLEEGVLFKNLLLPKSYDENNGSLSGVKFQPLLQAYDSDKNWNPVEAQQPLELVNADQVILAIGQELSFPFIKEGQLKFTPKGSLQVDPKTFQSSDPSIFIGGDAAFGPKNIITCVEHGHQAALSIHLFCTGQSTEKDRPPAHYNLLTQKMAMNQWSYTNGYSYSQRLIVNTEPVAERLKIKDLEVEKGFTLEQALEETQRCLNCDVQTVFSSEACIECDACVDICPTQCLTITGRRSEESLRLSLTAVADNLDQSLFVDSVPQTNRVMVKDENICLHCGLCAERCPTTAWDMQKFFYNKSSLAGGSSNGCK